MVVVVVASDGRWAGRPPPPPKEPNLDLSGVLSQHYCLHGDCEGEIMELRAALRESESSRWRAKATTHIIRAQLEEDRAYGYQAGSQASGDQSEGPVATNAMAALGETSLGHLESQYGQERKEDGHPTPRAQYVQDLVAHYRYHESLGELTDALSPLRRLLCAVLVVNVCAQLLRQNRRQFTPYSRQALRSRGAQINTDPLRRTRSRCRAECDGDPRCAAFAMPLSPLAYDWVPGSAAQPCELLSRYVPAAVPYDLDLDVDPSAGWATWVKRSHGANG